MVTIDQSEGAASVRTQAKAILGHENSTPPVSRIPPTKFDEMTANVFMAWIVEISGGAEGVKTSSCATKRSALFNLYREFGKTMNAELANELKVHYQRLRRDIAQATANGEGQIKVGKDPLQFNFYRYMSLEFLKDTDKEFTFARLFLVLCWNLMSRASNALSICFNHMEWSEDALCVYFAHMKNDQAGQRPHANPLMPDICHILALGMYWLSFFQG